MIVKHRLIALITIVLMVLPFYHINAQNDCNNCISGFTGNTPQSDEYVLVWADEFNSENFVCNENWHFQTQCIPGQLFCWANNELQHYTNRSDNAYVEDGVLKIVAKREDFTDQGLDLDYTSARLNSKFAFTYGRVDVRAKLTSELGTWPAIWMLGKNISEAGAFFAEEFGDTPWPATGEIDIMEQFGRSSVEKTEVHGTTHTPAGFAGGANGGKTSATTSTSEFHVYSMVWDENEIQFLYDDEVYYTYNPIDIYGVRNKDTWPFDEPQFLLLNIAMGGVLGGDVPNDFVEATMEIDYVRVYQNYDEGFIASEPESVTPDPTEVVSRVLSLYGDTYETLNGVSYGSDSTSSIISTEYAIGEEVVLKLEDLDEMIIDFSANTQNFTQYESLHFDYWTLNTTALAIGIINSLSEESSESVEVSSGCWVSVDVPLSLFNDQIRLEEAIGLRISGNGTLFIDNIYLVADETVQVPTLGPPEPQIEEELVKSLFSDNYSTVNGVNYNPDLGQSTIAALVSINGNNALRYSNFDRQGISFTDNPLDASELEIFHFDYWTPNDFELTITLNDVNDVSYSIVITTVAGEWTGVDLNLSELEILGTIDQVIFEGAGTLFLDNIYFYRENPLTQEINFDPIADISLDSGQVTFQAQATSGLNVIFESQSENIEIIDNSGTFLTPGKVEVVATQPGNNIYEAATPVTQSFCIIPSQPSITMSQEGANTILKSSNLFGNQWFLDSELISGQTNSELDVEQEGIYTVQVSVDDCFSPMSEELAVVITGNEETYSEVKIFPNPVSDLIKLEYSSHLVNIKLYDTYGRILPNKFQPVDNKWVSDISDLNSGIYLLIIFTSEENHVVIIVKE